MITSPDGKGVIIFGGSDQSSLYQLNCDDESGCKWDEMEQRLKVARSDFVAMIIPDRLTNCIKN
jgi:hypothetical protein